MLAHPLKRGSGTALQNFHGAAIFLNEVAIFSNEEACQGTITGCSVVAWSGAMMADLQIKVDKYESKAAKCKEWAQQVTDGPQRALYEVLAGYYDELATDFRQVIAKRKVA
jgi:hypothetical protein